MEDIKTIIEKIKVLVENANRLKGMEFRIALEGLVKEGETEAEHLLIRYISEPGIAPDIRMDIIRVAGYLQRPSFLIPLKKIIDTVQHSRIQKEAIISVSKFNDRRALNILSQALQRINNPMLMSTINAEISRIKENNPILALMPRFQEGEKNPKTFKVALDILKRILTPRDATIFTKFLTSQDPLIQSGAFEILCINGDVMHDKDILGFYNTRFKEISCIGETECEDLYLLTHYLKQYLIRYPFIIEEQVPYLLQHFLDVNDIRVKQLLISLICKSKTKEGLDFIRQIYPTDEKLQLSIVEEYKGNPAAVDFLFHLYENELSYKEEVIQSLLSIEQGLKFFLEKFFSLPFEHQELVVRHLPYAGEHDLTEFIKDVFKADVYRLKEILLGKVKDSYEFSVKKLLFAPEREREFFFMGQDYFDTITRLFPVTAVKRFMERIVSEDVSVTQAKKYLLQVQDVVPMELIFNFRDKEFIHKLFTKIINSNNRELSVMFLGILKFIKTLDIETYRLINDSMSLFVTKRETNISPEEKGELQRIKRSFHDLFLEFKRIEEGTAAFKRLAITPEVDLDWLGDLLSNHKMALSMKLEMVLDFLEKEFKNSTSENIDQWTRFFTRFPKLARLMKKPILDMLAENEGFRYSSLTMLAETFTSHPPRILMNFSNRHYTAVLKEEFEEAAPMVETVIDEPRPQDMDTLLCDAEMLKEMARQNAPLPPRIYLFLEQLEGFAELKDFNTKNFVQPFSFYRIVKEILQNLYI